MNTVSRTNEVRPLECWPKFKELRREAVTSLWNAPKEGRPIVVGLLSFGASLAGAFNAAITTFGPNFGKVLEDGKRVGQYCEIAEARGYGPDTCSNTRVQLACLYEGIHNVNAATGESFTPTFGLDVYLCPAEIKLNREFCEHYQIPGFEVELPQFAGGEAYMVGQMHEVIEGIEKRTGLKCDDERLIECVNNEWRSKVLFAKTCVLMKAIPAPVDLKTIITVISVLQNAKLYSSGVVSALQELLDETQYRVDNHISSFSVEKARLSVEGQGPWYTLGQFGSGFIWRSAVEYGAVGVATLTESSYGAWNMAEDGTLTVAPGLDERGGVLRNRDDALRALADLYVNACPATRLTTDLDLKARALVKLAQDWHIDAMIMNLDRSCHPQTMGLLEAKIVLQQAGIPCLLYEAPHCDPREVNMAEIQQRLETFMETVGLKKL